MYTADNSFVVRTFTLLIVPVTQVKCTGEKDGCRRCMENNARCSYNTSTSSRSLPKANTQGTNSPEAPPITSPTSTSTSEFLVSRLTPTPTAEVGSDKIGHCPNVSEDYSLIEENTDFFAGLTPDLDMVLGDAQQSYPFPEPFSTNGADSTILDATELMYPSLLVDTNSSEGVNASFGRRQKCSCSKMVRTYELAEVYLVWAPRDRSGATSIEMDDVLRCQKTVLASCEAVLSCDTCRLQSEKVMLMISICNKLLASFVQMSSAPPLMGQEITHATDSRQASPVKEKRSQTGRSSGKHRSLDFNVSEWKIDDEDKEQVLKTLLSSRAARLSDLIDRLEEVVRTNRWLVHRSMIRDLLERFAEHQPIWKL